MVVTRATPLQGFVGSSFAIRRNLVARDGSLPRCPSGQHEAVAKALEDEARGTVERRAVEAVGAVVSRVLPSRATGRCAGNAWRCSRAATASRAFRAFRTDWMPVWILAALCPNPHPARAPRTRVRSSGDGGVRGAQLEEDSVQTTIKSCAREEPPACVADSNCVESYGETEADRTNLGLTLRIRRRDGCVSAVILHPSLVTKPGKIAKPCPVFLVATTRRTRCEK